MAGKVRDEVAALTEVIEELRAEVAALRVASASHHCGGCHCFHYHYTPLPVYPTTTYPVTITYSPPYQTAGATTSTVAYTPSTVTSGAAGGATVYTLTTGN